MSTVEVSVSAGAHSSPVISEYPRFCTQCKNEIPAARLKAMPNAQQCVPCLESNGDVPHIKRYDENGTESYFIQNKTLERHINRVAREPVLDEFYELAVGDDYHLVRDNSIPKEHAYNLMEVFERALDKERLDRDKALSPESIPQVEPIQSQETAFAATA